MASIRKTFELTADPAWVWDAFRDVGAVHLRLARGFVTDTRLEGDTRIVTFANGVVAHERIVTVDDLNRRLVYAAGGGRLTHHNGAFEVLAAGGAGSRIVWTADLLPDAAAGVIEGMMEEGVTAMQRTLAPER